MRHPHPPRPTRPGERAYPHHDPQKSVIFIKDLYHSPMGGRMRTVDPNSPKGGGEWGDLFLAAEDGWRLFNLIYRFFYRVWDLNYSEPYEDVLDGKWCQRVHRRSQSSEMKALWKDGHKSYVHVFVHPELAQTFDLCPQPLRQPTWVHNYPVRWWTCVHVCPGRQDICCMWLNFILKGWNQV